METQQPASPSEPIIPPATHKPEVKNSLVLILSILLIVTVAIAGLFYFQIQKLSKELSKYQTQPSPTPTATTDPTANWKTYKNSDYSFSFSYPPSYIIQESSGYISLFSPADTANPNKDSSVNNKELKMEIYILPSPKNDSLEIYTQEQLDTEKEIQGENQNLKTVSLSGVKSTYFTWKGVGDGEIYLFLYRGKRFQLVKYPLLTNRQNEFNQILSTLKFSEATSSASPTTTPSSLQ